jgi:hypothetical protein
MKKNMLPKRPFAGKHLLWLLFPLVSGCLQPFNPPEISGGQGFLVVDGFLNAGGDTTRIRLTRTQNLNDGETPPAEVRAQVTIEGDRGASYPLREEKAGHYVMVNVPVAAGQQYRLYIRTSNGQEYRSDYVPVKITPPIDSVNWEVTGDGVQVYVNARDPAANTRFYRWEFEETWEFTTPYSFIYTYRAGNKEYPGENTYRCWKTTASRSVVLGTSARLSEDLIYQYPLVAIPPSSEKHQIRYSILVKQYALTQEGYDYWQNLKRNTENLGTLFDPQPSQVSGNIASVNNPSEPVFGFFSAYSVQQKRIFIARNQLPPTWRRTTGYERCEFDTIKNDAANQEFLRTAVFPVIAEYGGPSGRLEGYLTSEIFCMDCRLRGYNKQPPYW